LPDPTRPQSHLNRHIAPTRPTNTSSILYNIVDTPSPFVTLDTPRPQNPQAPSPKSPLNCLTTRPSNIATIFRIRPDPQRRQNPASLDFELTPDQITTLDTASALTPAIPIGISAGLRSGIQGRW
jgi:hypothetical protein